METDTPPPVPAPHPALLRRGKLKLANLPTGRFLYTIDGRPPWREGRIVERFDDPEKEDNGAWLKIEEGNEWVWSLDVWVEVELGIPETVDSASPRTSPPAERETERRLTTLPLPKSERNKSWVASVKRKT